MDRSTHTTGSGGFESDFDEIGEVTRVHQFEVRDVLAELFRRFHRTGLNCWPLADLHDAASEIGLERIQMQLAIISLCDSKHVALVFEGLSGFVELLDP